MKAYLQHEGKVLEAGKRFEHVMALTLNPKDRTEGVVRCITSREGDVETRGYLDRSKLFKIKGKTLEQFEITEPLIIQNQDEIIAGICSPEWDFIGLEDPDIFIDPQTNLTHLYFTIPLIGKEKKTKNIISLGHAEGPDLDSLVMTPPVLAGDKKNYENHKAKEVSIAPLNSRGIRLNLFESSEKIDDELSYSTVRVATAEDMGKPWEFGPTVFHPVEHKIPWIAEHASPGPLFSKEFIDMGEGKLLGIMNGREASIREGNKIHYKTFSVGLFIYDYEQGKIDWVSPEPLIRDSEAKTITFASHFVETKPGEGILYAHVDDSFVRAYTLKAEKLKLLLPH